MMDAIVEVDEKLMEKYLMEEPISHEEMVQVIPKALAAGSLVPIFCMSAKKDIGVTEFLDFVHRRKFGLKNLLQISLRVGRDFALCEIKTERG